MTSQIDPTVPVAGQPTTASVRSNFQIAHDEISNLQLATGGSPFLPIAGGRMSRTMYLWNDPTDAMMPATKGYVDAHGGGSGGGGIPEAPADGSTYGRNSGTWQAVVPLAGATMTGRLTLSADPTSALHAVTKQYADLHAGAVTVSDTAPANPLPGALWWSSAQGNLFISYADPNTQQWVIANTAGIGDAPSDANTYARSAKTWVPVVPSSGGAMSGLLTLSGDPVAALQAVTKQYADGGPTAANNVGRSMLHNGQYNVWQRGAGPWTSSGNYTADRWVIGASNDTVSVSQISLTDTDRQAIGDESAVYAIQNAFTGSTGYNFLQQCVEAVRRLGGKTVTLSFWARANLAGLKLGINALQSFGTGGSPSGAAWLTNGNSVAIGTTWARYSSTFTLPTTTGKTLGTNNNDSTGIAIWFSSGSGTAALAGNIGTQSGTVAIYGAQLEVGSVMTPLMRRDPKEDLSLCQRFFQTGPRVILQSYQGGGWGVNAPVIFPVPMRAAPSITVTNGSVATNVGTLIAQYITPHSFTAAGQTSTTGAFIIDCTYTASADL